MELVQFKLKHFHDAQGLLLLLVLQICLELVIFSFPLQLGDTIVLISYFQELALGLILQLRHYCL